MMTTSHKIILACDIPEVDQFADFLRLSGNDVAIGNDTGSSIDGVNTSNDESANVVMQNLWAAYCDSE